MARYLKRALIAAVLLLLVVVAALFIYTRTTSFDHLVRAKLMAYLAETYRGEISFGRIEVPLFGAVTLDQVVVHYQHAEVARIERVRVGYSLLPLLWGALHLRVEVLRPVMDLSRNRDGRWNLLEALLPKVPSPSSSSKLSIHVDSLAVRDASIAVAPEDPQGAKYHLSDASVTLRAAILPSGIRVSISQLTTRIEAPGFPAATATGVATYQNISTPASVEIPRFNLSSGNSMVSLSGTLSDFDQMNVDAELGLKRLAAVDLAKIFPKLKINQDLTGVLTLKGPRRALHGELALNAGSARIGAQILADFAAKAPRYDAKATLANVNVRTLLGAAYPSGLIGGSLNAHGIGTALADLTGEAKLNDRGVVANRLRLGDAVLNLTIKNGTAQFKSAITNGPSRVSADGTVLVSANPRYRMTVAGSHLDLRLILAAQTIRRSDLNFTLALDGVGFSPARMNSGIQFRLTRSTLAQFVATSGAVDARVANGRVRVSRATLISQGTVLSANGAMGLERETPVQASYRLQAASIAPWLKLARLDGDGKLAVNGTATGRFGDLRAKGTVTADGIHAGTESIAHVQATYDFAGIGPKTPYGTVTAAMENVVTGARLRRLDTKLTVGRGRPVPIKLVLTAEDSAGGRDAVTADLGWQPQLVAGRLTELELALPDGRWRLAAPANFSKDARAITLSDFRLSNGDRSLTLDGSIASQGAQNFNLKADRINLADFGPLVPQAQGLKGALALEVKINGTAAAPTVDAVLNATKLEINGQKLGDLALKTDYDAQAVNIDAALAQDARHRLTATGTLPAVLQWAPGFKARIGGNVNLHVYSAGLRLGPLGALAPNVVKDTAGLLAVDLTLNGPIERPRANGTLALNGGRAQVLPLGVTVTDAVMRLQVSPDELRLIQLAAHAGDGTLGGHGTVALSDYAPGAIKAQLNFHDWPAIDTQQYKATIDGQITAQGTSVAPRIGGKIDVLHATLRPDLAFLSATSDIAPDPTIIVIQPGAKVPHTEAGAAGAPLPEQSQTQPSRFNQMAINVQIKIHRDSWIRHQDAEVELEGDLRILKKPAAPVRIVGVINTVRGWINFKSHRFDLTKGAISFTGGNQIDPSLDINAQYKVTNYVVVVAVGGTAKKPTLKLSSQPELPQADVLSLLLFGKTTSALGRGQQASLQQQAASMAAGYAVSSIGQAVAQSLGLQAMGVQMSGISGSGGTVGFGHYVSQNTYVSVSQQFGQTSGQSGASTQGVSIQYYILSWLSVTSSSFSDGSREIDLNLTTQY